MTHGITWNRVTEALAADLQIGDTWVAPAQGTGYNVHEDGTVRGVGWLDLDGTAWTVTARDGDKIVAHSHDGRDKVQSTPEGARVLRVVG